MRIDRLGKLFEQKYSLQALAAGEDEGPLYPDTYEPAFEGPETYQKPGVLPQVTFPMPDMKDVGAKIRNWLDELYRVPNKQYNIIAACADSGAAKPKDDTQKNAIKGYQFCKRVMLIVNWLEARKKTATFSQIRQALTDLVASIKENIGAGGPEAQFMHVSDLIPHVIDITKSRPREQEIKVQRAKAKAGFAKMLSIAINILNYMNDLGGAPQVGGRFTPQPTETLDKERDWFFMNYGDQFGIPDLATWSFVTNTDPSMVPLLAKLIRTLRRPSKEAALVKAPRIRAAVHSMMRRAQLAKATNQPYLERMDPTLFDFEESGESPSVLRPEQLQQAVQQRDLEHEQRKDVEKQKQIEEDRERHVRKEGTIYLLDQLLRGIL